MTSLDLPAVVAVVGVSGGLGASTLACAVTRRLGAAAGRAVLVDLDLTGGGIDVTAGVEHLPGPRWGDLADLAGAIDVPALVAALPSSGPCAVLSAGRDPWGVALEEVPPPAVVATVLAQLRDRVDHGGPVVLDVPAPMATAEVLAVADRVVLLSGMSSRGLADLDAFVLRREPDTPLLVTRGEPPVAEVLEAITDATGADPVAHLVDDPRTAASAERGEWPGRSGQWRRAGDAILLHGIPPREAHHALAG